LVATILPASVYPLEIVQAARFVANTNNLAKLDAQPWDANVKAVARFPEVVRKMNEDLPWTMELGEAFVAQQKDVMDAVQSLRTKAQAAGTLKTSAQQVVVVTNTIVERTYQQTVVYVTNTVVQVQPANPQVVYVPQYNPQTVYVDNDDHAAAVGIVSFGLGIAVGAAIADNHCDWHYGGCYRGYYPPPPPYYPPPYRPPPGYPPAAPPPGYRPPPPGAPPGYRPPPPAGYTAQGGTRPGAPATTSATQRWQPTPSRVSSSGTPKAAASVGSQEARGWGSSTARPAGTPPSGARPAAAPTPATRPSPSPTPGAARPQPSAGGMPSRPAPAPAPAVGGASADRSAFGGLNSGAGAFGERSRGAASRTGGGGGGGGRGGRR